MLIKMKNKIKFSLAKIMRIFGKKLVLTGTPVIIENSKKEILLGKRSPKEIFYPSVWGLPGGMVEHKENFKDAAKREVNEELGVKIKIIKQLENYESSPNKNCPLHRMDVPFTAKITKGIPKPKDETTEVKWFKPAEIKKMKLAYTHKEILKKEGFI